MPPRGLALCFTLVVGVPAQDPPDSVPGLSDKQIGRLLRHARPEMRAWGAHYAARSAQESWTPLLLAAWARLGDASDEASRLERRILATALVEIRADVPAPEILRLAEFQRAEALWLAARDPERYQSVLEAMLDHDLNALEWTVVCTLLARRRSPRLAPALVRSLEFSTAVQVVDRPTGRASRRDLRRVSEVSHDGVAVPQSFPPVCVYRLSSGRVRGWEQVVLGPYPVFLRKSVVHPGRTLARRVEPVSPWQPERRLRFLESIVEGDVASFQVFTRHEVFWTNARALESAIASERARLSDVWRDLIATMARAGVVTSAEAARLKPRIRIEMEDRRRDQTTPLAVKRP